MYALILILLGQFRPICTRISLLNSSHVLLQWIPPIMPDEKIPKYQVLYVSNGVGTVERTLESNLTIPLEQNASHVNAIVRNTMPSDPNTNEHHKDLNECQFHLNLTDKRMFCILLYNYNYFNIHCKLAARNFTLSLS